MIRALIVYATGEGQTDQIAKRMAKTMTATGVPTDLFNVADRESNEVALDAYDAIVFGSSVHFAKYDPRIGDCIAQYRTYLREIPTAFFSVSLGMASTDQRDRQEAILQAEQFAQRLKWKPSMTECFAGAIRYSRYGVIKRRIVHWVADSWGAKTDFDRDYEYTDWSAVETFANRFTRFIRDCRQPRSTESRFRWSPQTYHACSVRPKSSVER